MEEQERILAQSEGDERPGLRSLNDFCRACHQRRRVRTVILGTDVIESSVTIPDVDLVIDTCEQKRLRWDATKKQSLLTLVMVSKDEAKQRSGRTGRVRDGEVMRLVSKSCFEELKPHVEPQIKHSRLAPGLTRLENRWKTRKICCSASSSCRIWATLASSCSGCRTLRRRTGWTAR